MAVPTTQMRLQAITGTFSNTRSGSAGILTDNSGAIAPSQIPGGDLAVYLSHAFSAIKRIHGFSSYSENVAGELNSPIKVIGTTPTLTVGDGDAEDCKVTFDGNTTNFSMGVDHTEPTVFRIATGDAFDGTADLELTSGGALAIAGDLTVNGGDATIAAGTGANASLKLTSDANEDAGDTWQIDGVQDTQVLQFRNDKASAGSFVSMLEVTPHATPADSMVNVSGILRLGAGSVENASAGQGILLGGDVDNVTVQLGKGTGLTTTVGDLKVSGNDIQDSGGNIHMTMTAGAGGKTAFLGDLELAGTAIDVDAASALTIGASVGANTVTLGAATSEISIPGDAVINGDLTVKGTRSIQNVNEFAVEDKVIGLGVPGGFLAGTYTVTSNVVTVAANGHGFTTGWFVAIADPAATEVITQGSYEITVTGVNAFTFAFTTGNVGVATDILYAATRVQDATVTGSGIQVFPASATETSFKWGSTLGWTVSGPAGSQGSLSPSATNNGALGQAGSQWSDLRLGDGGIIDWDTGQAGSMALTHAASEIQVTGGDLVMESTNKLALGGAPTTDYIQKDTDIKVVAAGDIVLDPAGNNVKPGSANTDSLGEAGVGGATWKELFLGDGGGAGGINFNNGEITFTQTDGNIVMGGTGPVLMQVPKLAIDNVNNYIDVNTDLQLVAVADILLDAGGNDVLVQGNAANPFLDLSRVGAGVSYMNFSTNDANAITGGSGGFGFRNNAGTMEFKDSGGSWATFSTDTTEGITSKTTITAGNTPVNTAVGLSFSTVGIPEAKLKARTDLFVNGQLLLSSSTDSGGLGTNNDYYMKQSQARASADVQLRFELLSGDIVTAVVRGSGS